VALLVSVLRAAKPRLLGAEGRLPVPLSSKVMDGSVGGLPRANRPVPLETAAGGRTSHRVTELLAREPFLVLLVAIQAVILCFRLPDHVRSDTWLSLVAGRLVARHGLPHHDTLAVWSHGRTWIDQQWLGQLALYWLHLFGGLRLLLLAHVVLLVAGFALALVFARRSGASARSVALVGILALLVALSNSVARTQTFAFLFFVALFWLLASDAQRPSRRVLLALPLLVAWANIHGSAVLGAGLVLLWAASELIRAGLRTGAWGLRARALGLAAAATLSLFVSPYGVSVVQYYRSVLGSGAFRDLVTEWQASTFPAQWPFFVLAVGGIWLVARKPRRLSLFEHLALLATAFAALDAVRNLVWFALVAVMVVPRALDDVWPVVIAPLRRRVNIGLSSSAVAVLVGSLAVAAAHSPAWYAKDYPQGAAAAVSRAANGDRSLRVFANEAFADWLLWKVPALAGRVAFDARFELMNTEELHAVARFRQPNAANRLAPASGYRLIVLDPASEKPAIRAVLREPGARTLYRDSHVAVLLRNSRA
jgi:hypothetical protein